nr:HipA domain-containing protein [Sinorhizobium meliloti]
MKTGLFPRVRRDQRSISKFNSDRIDNLVRNELLSLRWTAAVLGEREVTAFTASLTAAVDETALIVTRFDRRPNGEKLRLEDCAQILSKPEGQDYAGKYDAAYEDIAAIIVSTHRARQSTCCGFSIA